MPENTSSSSSPETSVNNRSLKNARVSSFVTGKKSPKIEPMSAPENKADKISEKTLKITSNYFAWIKISPQVLTFQSCHGDLRFFLIFGPPL